MAVITYTNKVDNRTTSLAAINKVTAADMNEIKASVNALYAAVMVNILAATGDFTGDDFQDDRLIGLTARTDFNMWVYGGSGVLLTLTTQYTFNSGTGTITIIPAALPTPPGADFLVQIIKFI